MNELTLAWHDAGQNKTQKISDQQPSKNPGSVRIGRDPQKCDILMSDLTVSGLHVEIFFNEPQKCFYIRNLRPSNPPLVNGQQLVNGEVALSQGSTIYLGQSQLTVTAVDLSASSIPPTILTQPAHSVTQPPEPLLTPQHQAATPQQKAYGLMCPKCNQISPYEQLDFGCPWCGTSLAAAASALINPHPNSQ
jgi:FHA domain